MLFDADILNEIKEALVKKKETLSVAESVTSGFLQIAFGSADDASLFFQGGITAYNLGQKCRHLPIEAIHALQCDCVSEKIAVQMAIGANQFFTSDFGIGITGYATSIPEKGIDKLFAWYSIAYKQEIVESKKN